MDFIDILTKKTVNLEDSDLITLKEKSNDFLISVPHSGQLIPSNSIDKFNLDAHALPLGTDFYTDLIADIDKGMILTTKLSSSFVNVSRFKSSPNDPSLPKHLNQACYEVGSLTDEQIQIKPYSQEEINLALKYYDLYHQKIKDTIAKLNSPKVIIDLHSMSSLALPNTPDAGNIRPDLNTGTLNDTSASSEIIDKFNDALQDASPDIVFRKNHPYNGGVITQLYGQPDKDIHCIQLEIKKEWFMNESLEGGDFKANSDGVQEMKRILQDTLYLFLKN
ncbi:MAG: hypothetical protein CMH63_03205 [Nanoarchaeota archaeon]|jgi:N-formylglutamate amidohydrolase|nr:hypothetical protein [Nanoarchaeota archaeon]|tara:strand:+ start:10472 stop:11305 length:834 start_codon:yes stop_codon:yes gene_type:complete